MKYVIIGVLLLCATGALAEDVRLCWARVLDATYYTLSIKHLEHFDAEEDTEPCTSWPCPWFRENTYLGYSAGCDNLVLEPGTWAGTITAWKWVTVIYDNEGWAVNDTTILEIIPLEFVVEKLPAWTVKQLAPGWRKGKTGPAY